MTSIFDIDNNSDSLSVEACILKLVKLSLKRRSTKIAIRFDPKKHKIQVVDNGIGFNKPELLNIFDTSNQKNDDRKNLLSKIRALSSVVIVTSRSDYSPHTYVKIVSESGACKFFKGYHRPSKGTTITAYDFNTSACWDSNEISKDDSISYVVAAIALIELKVSFSLRNDDQNRVLLFVGSPHNAWEVLKYMINNRIDRRVNIEKQISPIIDEKKNEEEVSPNVEPIPTPANFLFASLLDKSTDKSTDDDDEIDRDPAKKLKTTQNSLFFTSLLDKSTDDESIKGSISDWSNGSRGPSNVATIALKNNAVVDHDYNLCCSANRNNRTIVPTTAGALNDDIVHLSQLTVWSDWSYRPINRPHGVDRNTRFRRLPIEKKKLDSSAARYRSGFPDDDDAIKLLADRYRHPDVADGETCLQYSMENIRFLLKKIKFRRECRISKDTINSLKILRQINNEFIVGITRENGNKLLILIDQHAVHERIRYEWLFDGYRDKKSRKFFAERLYEDLLISDIDSESLKILIQNKKILKNVGIKITSIVDSTSCTVDRVPKCFVKSVKSYNHNSNFNRLIKNVRELLLEMADGLAVKKGIFPHVLPFAINNVIASEACHQAIKFGDPLTVEDCKVLIKALQDTKNPVICAHGRPSIVPLMDLTGLENWRPPVRTRLNFEALKRSTHGKKV